MFNKTLFKIAKIDSQIEALSKHPNDKELALNILKTDGYLLWKVSPKLQDDKEVVLTAVANAGWALAHASERLKADKEVVTTALNHDRSVWSFMSTDLLNDQVFFFRYKMWQEENLLWSVKPYRA